MHKGISVVIPNYNGSHLFPETLPPVFAALETIQLPYEVIICDDRSTDDSISFLHKNFAEVKIVANEKNEGFPVTANKGIQNASFDLVLLLNSDVKLEPDYFVNQLKYFEQGDTFGVMGRIVGWNDDQIQDAAKYPSFHGLKIKTSLNYILEEEHEMKNGLYSMYVSGANSLLDRNKFLQLRGFNELFSPFYVEDYELSLRAWRCGWKCYYEHTAVCRHQASTTIRSKNRKSFIKTVYNRNKMFLHAIHLNKKQRAAWMIQLFSEVMIQTLLFKGYYTKAFFLFLKNYRRVKSSRKDLKVFAGKELLSVSEVAEFILAAVKGKRIKTFLSGQA